MPVVFPDSCPESIRKKEILLTCKYMFLHIKNGDRRLDGPAVSF